MRYAPCWLLIGISRDRYFELLHYCRQYPEWKLEADSLLGIRAIKMDGQPHGTTVGDPVSSVAERRERLLEKMTVVEECAAAEADGGWASAIIQNVCIGKSYDQIDKTILPTSTRSEFFRKRRNFFAMLNARI